MLGSLKTTLFLLIVLSLTILSSALAVHNQEQGQTSDTRNQRLIEEQKKQTELEAQFPTVDYDAPEATNDPEKSARRKETNKHFDKKGLVYRDPTTRISEVARIIEGYDVPALPIAQSSLIISGGVVNSQAYLSNDKRGVYTELTIRVNEVIKNNASAQVAQGDTVIAEREGGIVRYSNGHKRLYHLAEEGMPATGRKYLLFLRTVEGEQDYYVLTGYELSPTRVIPVDLSWRFKGYDGNDVESFLSMIRTAVTQPQPTAPSH
jgi:hypothetical protein